MREMSLEEERAKILPIDRGWAWVVVLASAGLFALHAGGFRCQGILLVEINERFNGVYLTSTLIWVLSIKYIITGLLGPLASLIIVKTSCRTAALMGVFLDALSYVGLAYSPNLPAMLVSHSLVGGVGNSLIVLVPFLVSGPYFQKRKALALGLTAGGSGLGGIVLPYIFRPLFDNYSFSGASLLYAGFTLHFLVLSSLLRPISYYESLYSNDLEYISRRSKVADSEGVDATSKLLSGDGSEYEIEMKQTDQGRASLTAYNVVSHSGYSSGSRAKSQDHACSVPASSTGHLASSSNLNTSGPASSYSASGPTNSLSVSGQANSLSVSGQANSLSVSGQANSLSVSGQARSPAHQNNKLEADSVLIISTGDLFASATLVCRAGGTTPLSTELTPLSQDHFNWRVLLMPKFLLVGFSIAAFGLGVCVVFSALPPLGKELGISKDAIATALTCSGVLDTPSRILNGLLADRKLVSATVQFSTCLLIAGFLTFLNAVVYGFPGIILTLIGMSMAGTSTYSLTPVVLRELIGIENLTSGMGLVMAFQSTAFICSTYITGAIYDATQSWRIVYFYIGSSMVAGGAITGTYCLYKNCKTLCSRNQPTNNNKL